MYTVKAMNYIGNGSLAQSFPFFMSSWSTAKRVSLFAFVTLFFVFMQFTDMLFKVKIPAEPFTTFLTCKWFLIIVRVHVKCQIVHLMESLSTDMALKGLFSSMSQSVIFVVSFLMESFAANVTNKWFIPGVNTNVSVESGGSVKSFSANVTLMRLFFRMDDLVPAKRACLPEALAAYFTLERSCACVYWHVTRQVVMCVENFAANFAGKRFGCSVTTFAADGTHYSTRHLKRRGFCVFQSKKTTSGNKNSRAWVTVIASRWRRHQGTIEANGTAISRVARAWRFFVEWLAHTDVAVVRIKLKGIKSKRAEKACLRRQLSFSS